MTYIYEPKKDGFDVSEYVYLGMKNGIRTRWNISGMYGQRMNMRRQYINTDRPRWIRVELSEEQLREVAGRLSLDPPAEKKLLLRTMQLHELYTLLREVQIELAHREKEDAR